MDIDKEEPMYTVEQITRVLNVNRKTVYKLINTGELPAIVVSGGHLRVSRKDFWEWRQKSQKYRSRKEEERQGEGVGVGCY